MKKKHKVLTRVAYGILPEVPRLLLDAGAQARLLRTAGRPRPAVAPLSRKI